MYYHLIRHSFLLFCLTVSTVVRAQDNAPEWSLQKCIQYAVENSLQVQQASLAKSQAVLVERQSLWAQAPTVNGSLRSGMSLGRSVDLTTNDITLKPVFLTSLSVNANWLLYQGMQVRNTIKQSRMDVGAAEQDIQQAKNDVALSVAKAYLSILLAQESKGVLEEQIKVTRAQLEQTSRLIKGGVLAENSRFDLEAQIARDEEAILVAQNNLDLAYVNLKVIMNYEVDKLLKVQAVGDVEIAENAPIATLEELYAEALKNQPNILAAQMRENSAQLAVNIAKGALTPSISIYGGLGTNYSSQFQIPTGTVPDTTFGVVIATGQETQSYGRRTTGFRSINFFEQLAGNISGNIGINVSVPIFNGLRSRISIQRAELNTRLTKLNSEQLKVTLKANIARALTDVRAADKRLAAARKSVRAIRLSVENTRRRYDLGVVNSFELTSVQNTLTAAESSVLQAKYDYLFKLKILDFYLGRPIEITQ